MRILDLFCGAGGASMGLHRAFPDAEIVGVDLHPQPRYPFTFRRGDAMQVRVEALRRFDLVWASPPCQGYSKTQHIPGRRASASAYPQLVEPTRERLLAAGVPFIIENTQGAPLRNPVTLCGLMFDLRVFRHRRFESSWPLTAPTHLPHVERVNQPTNGKTLGYYTREPGRMVTVAGHLFSRAAGSEAMDIDWMTCAELAEAIPPAYSEYLGRQFAAVTVAV